MVKNASRKIVVATAFAAAVGQQLSACSPSSAITGGASSAVQANQMNSSKLTTPFDALAVGDLPSVVPASAEQSQYVVALTNAMIRVLSRESTLEDEERALFGEGEYFWPKDPAKPVRVSRSYDAANFRVNFVSLSFARPSDGAPWTGAALAVTPKAFPRSAYQFAVPADFFSAMRFVKGSEEERPANGSAPARKVHVFEYALVRGDVKLTLRFEARGDLSNLKDQPPKTFDLVKITKT
jgi:hypothetical protein